MTGKFLAAFLVFSVLCLSGINAAAQQDSSAEKSNIVKVNLSQTEIDKIVQVFSAKEGQYRQALNQYGFKREATVQTVGFGGQVSGEYRRDSQFTFGDDGRRYEKVMFAPISKISDIVTPEDLEDLGGVNQFALEAAKINQYNFTFVGKEKIDELNLYVFDVAPKLMPDPKKTKERFFQGRVWVDDQDLQIVKTKGKGVPETTINKFPVVETWRENIDTKFWFPTYAYANDKLYFEKNGSTLHIKLKIKFSDYKQGRSEVRILDEDGSEVQEKPQAVPDVKPIPKKPQ
jgi:hypothetical protein